MRYLRYFKSEQDTELLDNVIRAFSLLMREQYGKHQVANDFILTPPAATKQALMEIALTWGKGLVKRS